MLKIKNCEWECFSNGLIMQIANELNCPIKYPDIEVNKWCNGEYYKYKKITDFTTEEEFYAEQERVSKINNERFDQYMHNIVNWLKENKYIV